MTWKCFPLLLLAVCLETSVLAGDFWTHCHERHFWVTIKSTFLAEKFGFNFEDRSVVHIPSAREAAKCGYTAFLNHRGDLVFRASFLACNVLSQNDTEYSLNMWFWNRWANGTATAFPFRLYCALQWPWGAREIVCEENYMEVSVQLPVLHASFKAQPDNTVLETGVRIHRQSATGEDEGEASLEPVMSWREASDLGYLVSHAGPRLLLRAAYSSPLSYTVKEQGLDMEVMSASILLSVQGVPMAVSTVAACNKNQAVVDGPDLLWADPHAVPQLTRGRLREGPSRLGVGPLMVSAVEAQERGYRVRLSDGRLELRVPLASPGVDVTSAVVEGRYGQRAGLQLFFLRHTDPSGS
ncbi:uncharacterized protein LOC130370508 [Gadus chalcogrammus]|uniref:uncharacterized protein LOC130370508 n=1 Tax=Gadus chalcogrammus TaxID=1042646 RepID=UPI0024C4C527|nr:uncharacterized protein LOC130370508 [Gadus chalcogrammus]